MLLYKCKLLTAYNSRNITIYLLQRVYGLLYGLYDYLWLIARILAMIRIIIFLLDNTIKAFNNLVLTIKDLKNNHKQFTWQALHRLPFYILNYNIVLQVMLKMIMQIFILLFLIGLLFWLVIGIKNDIKHLIKTIKEFRDQ